MNATEKGMGIVLLLACALVFFLSSGIACAETVLWSDVTQGQ
jgi:hypothetical protein